MFSHHLLRICAKSASFFSLLRHLGYFYTTCTPRKNAKQVTAELRKRRRSAPRYREGGMEKESLLRVTTNILTEDEKEKNNLAYVSIKY